MSALIPVVTVAGVEYGLNGQPIPKDDISARYSPLNTPEASETTAILQAKSPTIPIAITPPGQDVKCQRER
jgi:hypothetical protein